MRRLFALLFALFVSAPAWGQGVQWEDPWGNFNPWGDQDSPLAEYRFTPGQTVTWVGDSITEQGKGAGIGWTDYIEAHYPAVTFVNEGIGGNTTLDVIARLSSIMASNADVYFVAVGVNDVRYNDARGATTQAAYLANVKTITDALKATGARVGVISIWPTFWKDAFAALGRAATDARIVAYNTALAAQCATDGIGFVNAHDPIVAAINLHNVATLIPDGVHPDWDGSAFVGTGGRQLYAEAVGYRRANATRFVPEYTPVGVVFYKLVIPDNDATGDVVSIQNINPGPSLGEFFAYSAIPAVNPAGLFGPYNASAGGFLNKPGDWPVVMTFSGGPAVTEITTHPRGTGQGIRKFELYQSTDPAALTRPTHASWTPLTSEASNAATTHNLLPAQRAGVYYRLQVDSSNGTDGTGGATGTYVKVTKVWGGTPPVRWALHNFYEIASIRTDLYFSPIGGGPTVNLYNNANAYPCSIMWEAETHLTSLEIASVQGGGASGRAIKDWKLFRSTDAAALPDAAHASWAEIATGTGDQTIGVPAP
jgi:lysophospholipase L1-like esterase